jgi:hypothetical protein
MKLADAAQASLIESSFFEPLCEAGEAPRWSFAYDAWKQDPHPDILLLGAYHHPNTGNDLVGGINLNYLSAQQRDGLARVLPQIMQTGNLYSRYHAGKRLLPDVFDNFYRTYDSKYVRGVTQDVFYPKYGLMKTAQDFLKKTVGGLFKGKQDKETEPEFPSDLSGMKDQLDQVVARLNQQATQRQKQGLPEPETPEMQAARQNFQQFRMDRARQQMVDPDIEPFLRANQELQTTQLQQGQVSPQAVDPGAVTQAITEPPAQPELTPQEMGQQIAKDQAENREELINPDNDIDLDPETQGLFNKLDDLDECVMYYSPVKKRYIIEHLGEARRRYPS